MDKRTLALVQGTSFAATGVSPLIDLDSFEAVPARKWTSGSCGPLACWSRPSAPLSSAPRSGAGSRRISKIYFADAALEAAIVA